MTPPVLVLVDRTTDGAVRPVVGELLALAGTLGDPHAVWVSGGPTDGSVPDAARAALAAAGASTVHVVDVGDADRHLTPVVAEALAAVLTALETQGTPARAVLVASSFENKEAAARLGVLTGAGVVVDATGLEHLDGRLMATKSVLAGTWTTRCAVRTPLAVVAMKAGATAADGTTAPGAAAVVEHTVTVSARARRATLVSRTESAPSDRPDLGAAQVVVVGGRGTEGNFGPVEDLADALGGAVGATRVATDEGWIGHDAQIGQTGVTVSPRLYVGAGVSGAVHHRGGMQSAGTIVAVNSDPEAPIFEIADFGVVGDLFAVLPQAAAELRRRRG